MVWLGAVLGLRWFEVAGLRVGRIDLSAGRLAVAEALVRGTGGRNVFGSPKSKAGRRTMFMPAAIVTMLREHLDDSSSQKQTAMHSCSWTTRVARCVTRTGGTGRHRSRLYRRRLPRPAAAECHHARRRRNRCEDGTDSAGPRRPQGHPVDLRLCAGLGRPGGRRHSRTALLRPQRQCPLRLKPENRKSFRAISAPIAQRVPKTSPPPPP